MSNILDITEQPHARLMEANNGERQQGAATGPNTVPNK